MASDSYSHMFFFWKEMYQHLLVLIMQAVYETSLQKTLCLKSGNKNHKLRSWYVQLNHKTNSNKKLLFTSPKHEFIQITLNYQEKIPVTTKMYIKTPRCFSTLSLIPPIFFIFYRFFLFLSFTAAHCVEERDSFVGIVFCVWVVNKPAKTC